MNAELQQIDVFLRSNGLTPKSYLDLSKDKFGNALVLDSTVEAFCFDDLMPKLFYYFPNSMDAILLKDNLYFIEFKRVVSSYFSSGKRTKGCGMDTVIKQNLQLKLINSLYIIKEIVLKKLGLSGLSFSIRAIIVIDHIKSPTTALAGALSALSKKTLTPDKFLPYFSKDKEDRFCFFDSLEIWNDLNFSAKICGKT